MELILARGYFQYRQVLYFSRHGVYSTGVRLYLMLEEGVAVVLSVGKSDFTA